MAVDWVGQVVGVAGHLIGSLNFGRPVDIGIAPPVKKQLDGGVNGRIRTVQMGGWGGGGGRGC